METPGPGSDHTSVGLALGTAGAETRCPQDGDQPRPYAAGLGGPPEKDMPPGRGQ